MKAVQGVDRTGRRAFRESGLVVDQAGDMPAVAAAVICHGRNQIVFRGTVSQILFRFAGRTYPVHGFYRAIVIRQFDFFPHVADDFVH